MRVLWSTIVSFFHSLFGGAAKALPVREVGVDEDASAEVIKLVVPDARAEQPEREATDPEDLFVLDDSRTLGDFVVNVLAEMHMPRSLPADQAYVSAAEEFARRGMASLVIPMAQFLEEWHNGVLRTVEYRQVGGNGGMTVPGCPLNDFTRIVAAMVKSAANNPPGVSEILKGRQYYYYVEIGHGTIRGISRMRD